PPPVRKRRPPPPPTRCPPRARPPSSAATASDDHGGSRLRRAATWGDGSRCPAVPFPPEYPPSSVAGWRASPKTASVNADHLSPKRSKFLQFSAEFVVRAAEDHAGVGGRLQALQARP